MVMKIISTSTTFTDHNSIFPRPKQPPLPRDGAPCCMTRLHYITTGLESRGCFTL